MYRYINLIKTMHILLYTPIISIIFMKYALKSSIYDGWRVCAWTLLGWWLSAHHPPLPSPLKHK